MNNKGWVVCIVCLCVYVKNREKLCLSRKGGKVYIKRINFHVFLNEFFRESNCSKDIFIDNILIFLL